MTAALTEEIKKTWNTKKMQPTVFFSELKDTFPYDNAICRDRNCHTSIHLGQRKLFNALMAFLTQYAEQNDTVIYIGAAPGNNIQAMINIMQKIKFKLKWVLYDSNEIKVKEQDNVSIRKKYFTSKEIESLLQTEKNILFFSDIRSSDGGSKTEEHVRNDMELQRTFVTQLLPKLRAFSLKFRIPFYLSNNKQRRVKPRIIPISTGFYSCSRTLIQRAQKCAS